MKRALALTLVLASAGSTSACGTDPAASVPQKCADGKGTWIEDDNGWLEETRVTVRLCLDEAGRVLELEVN